jgi:hypothetical protein
VNTAHSRAAFLARVKEWFGSVVVRTGLSLVPEWVGVYCELSGAKTEFRSNPLAILRTALFVLLVVTIAAADKTPPAYQKGTVKAWDIRVDSDTSGGSGGVMTTKRRARVYELNGADLVYKIDYCGRFQAGKFDIGQVVDYRVDGERLYIRRDEGKEYKCKIEGTKTAKGAKTDDPSTTH